MDYPKSNRLDKCCNRPRADEDSSYRAEDFPLAEHASSFTGRLESRDGLEAHILMKTPF
jgi:hypothetical protein